MNRDNTEEGGEERQNYLVKRAQIQVRRARVRTSQCRKEGEEQKKAESRAKHQHRSQNRIQILLPLTFRLISVIHTEILSQDALKKNF